MKAFMEKYNDMITGVLSGFDRILFRGTLRRISSVSGMLSYFSRQSILLKDFTNWATSITTRLCRSSESIAKETERPVHYIRSSSIAKEDFARSIAKRDKIDEGLICVLKSVDPCMSFDIRRNHETKRLDLISRARKCLWLYHYWMHPFWGFMHARIQTWAPFTIKVCANGREWLAKKLTTEAWATLTSSSWKQFRKCFVSPG